MRIYKNGVLVSSAFLIVSIIGAILLYSFQEKNILYDICIGVFSSSLIFLATTLGAYIKKRNQVFWSLQECVSTYLQEYSSFMFEEEKLSIDEVVDFEWEEYLHKVCYDRHYYEATKKLTNIYANYIAGETYSPFFNSRSNQLINRYACLFAKLNSVFQYIQIVYKRFSISKVKSFKDLPITESEFQGIIAIIFGNDEEQILDELIRINIFYDSVCPPTTVYNTDWQNKYKNWFNK